MNVLALAVHPDDETLGCGGTLLRHAGSGDKLHWLIVTAADPALFSPDIVLRQTSQVEAVAAAYGFVSLHWLKLPSAGLERLALNVLIREIHKVAEELRPEIVYLPNRSDVHSDHRVVFSAAQAVFKSFYMGSLGVKRLLACEVLSETDAAPPLPENAFLPNVFVDVTSTLRRKLEIMSLFQTEVHPGYLPRGLSALEALARYRGAIVGVEYAEAFMLIREIG